MRSTTLTILADNTVAHIAMRGEHGLSILVEHGGETLLFDTGQGLVLSENAQAAGVSLSAVQTVVLSHGHYDHSGGLDLVLSSGSDTVTVYAHSQADRVRFSHRGGVVRAVGMPSTSRRALGWTHVRRGVTDRPLELLPGVWSTGPVPRTCAEEYGCGKFTLDEAGCQPDSIPDDQALWIETPSGILVLLGCAHSGVINTLTYVRQLTGGRPLRAVIGGMHLGASTRERLDWTAAQIKIMEPEWLIPLHCTGEVGFAHLRAVFHERCLPAGAGSRFTYKHQ